LKASRPPGTLGANRVRLFEWKPPADAPATDRGPITLYCQTTSGSYREKRGRERVDRGKTECDRSGGIKAATALTSLERPVFSLALTQHGDRVVSRPQRNAMSRH
jgi:hypothetical protein